MDCAKVHHNGRQRNAFSVIAPAKVAKKRHFVEKTYLFYLFFKLHLTFCVILTVATEKTYYKTKSITTKTIKES